eukprot:360154-Chlamydomonas_euryale.AAC.5
MAAAAITAAVRRRCCRHCCMSEEWRSRPALRSTGQSRRRGATWRCWRQPCCGASTAAACAC